MGVGHLARVGGLLSCRCSCGHCLAGPLLEPQSHSRRVRALALYVVGHRAGVESLSCSCSCGRCLAGLSSSLGPNLKSVVKPSFGMMSGRLPIRFAEERIRTHRPLLCLLVALNGITQAHERSCTGVVPGLHDRNVRFTLPPGASVTAAASLPTTTPQRVQQDSLKANQTPTNLHTRATSSPP